VALIDTPEERVCFLDGNVAGVDLEAMPVALAGEVLSALADLLGVRQADAP
jgi:hypothetical protein